MIIPEKLQFMKYKTTDKYGMLNGIRDDAPEDMKEQYWEYLRITEEAKKRNDKLQVLSTLQGAS